MLNPPPFKLASAMIAAAGRDMSDAFVPQRCCQDDDAAEDAPLHGRVRLADLNPHLHCSLLGTCLSTAELRRLMARFIDVRRASDLDVHHEAVRLTGEDARIAKTLHKALDKRHEAVVQRFARTRDAAALGALWDEALRQGEIPGAYWAVLTHRSLTPELRQRAFGDVHMLSHLVGVANRADIRRLVALEKDNADLHDRLERQQARAQQLLEERDAALAQLQRHLAGEAARQALAEAPRPPEADTEALTAMVAVQAVRRERAEAAAASALTDAERLQQELDHLREHAQTLGRELAAAEVQLRERSAGDGAGAGAGNSEVEAGPPAALAAHLKGRRILYVGGRPSSTPAIRDLVQRHGGEFQRHDGGLEDRKGLLESAVAWAEFVLFPVDCIDHDSAGRLKRLCLKLGTPFLPLRSASVASFAAAVSDLDDTRSPGAQARLPTLCLRHG
jgi:hypothetical protein